MIKAVLFDLDDTLILDDAVSHDAYLATAQLAAPLGADVGRLAGEALEIARRRWLEGPYYAYCNRIGHSATEGLWAGYAYGDHPAIAGLRAWTKPFRTAVWREALALQGIVGEGVLDAMAARFFEARRRYPLYPEIEALLAHSALAVVDGGLGNVHDRPGRAGPQFLQQPRQKRVGHVRVFSLCHS